MIRTLALTVALLLVATALVAESTRIELTLTGGELPRDQRVIRVRQGDDVTLRWTTDRPLTIHLHGYDIERALTPGTPVEMRFTARATGRFAIETHAHGEKKERTVGYLEVHPR